MISQSCYYVQKAFVRRSIQSTRPDIFRASSTSTTKDESTSKEESSSKDETNPSKTLVSAGIAREICAEYNLSLVTAKKIVDTVFLSISESVAEGKNVRVKSFGTFAPVLRSERKVSAFGKPMTIPARTVIKFNPSKALRESVSKSTTNSTSSG